MRFAGVVASLGVMMSFSRRIGTCPSIKRRVRWSSLVTTQSPMMIRSRGLSSTFSAIRSVLASPDSLYRAPGLVNETLSGGSYCFPPLVTPDVPNAYPRNTDPYLAKQPQHRLIGLRGERQRRGRKLLAGLQRQHVGAFLIVVGEDEVVGADLQRVDHRLGELGAILHD